MLALSVRQPWASLIARGTKSLELRSWSTRYRGPLLICAAGRACSSQAAKRFPELVAEAPRGVALCVAHLLDVIDATHEHAQSACVRSRDIHAFRFAWRLVDPISVAHVAVVGRLGLFRVDDHVICQI